MPSGSCPAYATTQSGLSSTPPPGQQLRARPDFPVPADLQANAGPAACDTFKRATDARAAWLACSTAFCVVILDSIGVSNRLAISNPDTDTLHLSPRTIRNGFPAWCSCKLTGKEVSMVCRRLAQKSSHPTHSEIRKDLRTNQDRILARTGGSRRSVLYIHPPLSTGKGVH
jgi:hypothetical protein